MSIGIGWYPKEEDDENHLIAKRLLREKLTYVFDKWSEEWLKNSFKEQ